MYEHPILRRLHITKKNFEELLLVNLLKGKMLEWTWMREFYTKFSPKIK